MVRRYIPGVETTPGVWSSPPVEDFTYQWQVCDATGANCVDIPGATGPHCPVPPSEGTTIRVRVTSGTTDDGEPVVSELSP